VSNAPIPPRQPRPADAPAAGDTGQPAEHTQEGPGPAATDPDFRQGTRPVPEYTLIVKLGEGGFGQVWRARDDSGFEVALKFLRIDGRAGAAESRALDIMKNVRHAHLLPMFREWRVSNWLVLAFELAEKTLHQRLGEAKTAGQVGIPRTELLEYLRDAARALDYLHSLNIQHRDIKPQNILLVGGTVKVADYGLAKLLEHSQASNSGSMTASYAAPEFLEHRTSEHSDQYSLAISYCELRGGKLPFRGNLQQVLVGHLQGEPDLSMLPEAERPPIARALSKKPEDRWPSCREFVRALIRAVSRAPRSNPTQKQPKLEPLPTERPRPAPTPKRPKPELPRTLSTTVLSRQRRVWPIVLAVTVLAVLVPVSLLLWPASPSSATGRAQSLQPQPSSPILAVKQAPPPLDCTGADGISASDVRQAQEAWAKYLGRKVVETVEITNGVTMAFVLVPPGKFLMGSFDGEADRDRDEKLHVVVLTKPFDLARYEVTQAEYEALTGNNPSNFKGSDLPVEQVTWELAQDYGVKLTEKRADKHEYRLPTEAEWEYGCRGGRSSSLPFGIGNGKSLSFREANFNGNDADGGAEKGNYLQETRKVGFYRPNAFGLYDMHGNVSEWCADYYGPYLDEEVLNPAGSAMSTARVIRGGSWLSRSDICRSAYRRKNEPGYRFINVGFRLARSIPSASQ
jgi:formylglycine-generating enzyme required for sulfatase activity